MEDRNTSLFEAAASARAAYSEILAGAGGRPWWSAVILTAGCAAQAVRYEEQLRRRTREGKLPPGVSYLVVPDPHGRRVGSGGATINALRALAGRRPPSPTLLSLDAWWAAQRVLMIHAGGDSRRLPQYSPSGKLFTALAARTPWGELSTVLDEMLILSTAWAESMPPGLLVASGDVVLTLDAARLRWDRPGVTGVAVPDSVEVGSRHGVYVTASDGRVYSFLQKPSVQQVRAAGGFLSPGQVAVDTGLLYFDTPTAARLTELAGLRRTESGWTIRGGILDVEPDALPLIDLYEHVTMGLTGQWKPGPRSGECWQSLAQALSGVPFWTCVVPGEFLHVGTTRLFRNLLVQGASVADLQQARQRVGQVTAAGMRSSGVVIDSVLGPGSEIGYGAVAIECNLAGPVRTGRGAILHGLDGLSGPVEVPDDTVVHQVPVALPDGGRGFVIRVYGVEDDPKGTLESGAATWFGRPVLEVLEALGIRPDSVWSDPPTGERSLWNAALFPLGERDGSWEAARWMMRLPSAFSLSRWNASRRLSLATSAAFVDDQALGEARLGRMQAQWGQTALSLATSGADLRPLLSHAPGLPPLRDTGRVFASMAGRLSAETPTQAASLFYQASLFLDQAGLGKEAGAARQSAFRSVARAVELGAPESVFATRASQWRRREVAVEAPARIDLGGGWSDTPPFCIDWGGAVLNIAVELNGAFPIGARIRTLPEPLVRCISLETGERAEFRSLDELMAARGPGRPFAIPAAALALAGVCPPGASLEASLGALGGGLEIQMDVRMPLGSGLGTSSILGATTIRALGEMLGLGLSDSDLSGQVLRLEQLMTTGGGWQDQAGGIFPGAKLVTTGPGFPQRLRVEPIRWAPARQAEFTRRMLLYYTGIPRIAKDLLAQVVGSYLARETRTVQVLHSIKTLALEMAHALREGDWDHLGGLLDRHWELNQLLDPNTTNAPINAMLRLLRPYLSGAKLAGAGGGGFLILLARDEQAATELRRLLRQPAPALRGALYDYRIAAAGLRVLETGK